MIPVDKKSEKWRICIDYRGLNAITKKNAYPMPRIDQILDVMSGSKIFRVRDVFSGYHQVKVSESDGEKTAFGCRLGTYEFLKMPL